MHYRIYVKISYWSGWLYPKCGMQMRCIIHLRLVMLDAIILSVCIGMSLCGGVEKHPAQSVIALG